MLFTKFRHLEAAHGKKWGKNSFSDDRYCTTSQEHTYIALFRTITGDEYLTAHLRCIHLLPSLHYPFSGSKSVDGGHLEVCPSLDLKVHT